MKRNIKKNDIQKHKYGGNYMSEIFNILPSNFMISTSMLNKTALYNIKNNLSNYYISNNYDTNDFYVVIDGISKKIINISEIYFNRAFINKNNFNQELFDKNITKIDTILKTSQLYNKIKTYSLIKTTFNNKKMIIKSVIIDNGKYIAFSSSYDINSMNKMYADLLQCDFIKYTNLSKSNYKKCIDSHYKNITNSNFIFITFSNFINNSNINWTDKILGINFLCKKCNKSQISQLCKLEYINSKNNIMKMQNAKNVYILFLTINKNDLSKISIKPLPFHNELFPQDNQTSNLYKKPMHFSPSTKPNAFIFISNNDNLDNKIVKLSYNVKNNEWNYIDIISSKKTDIYGDNFKTTELTIWSNYFNPIAYSDLNTESKNIQDDVYFINDKNIMYEAPIKFNNFIKNNLIKTTGSNKEKIIDLAGGRGSDLFNYRLSNIKKLLYIEIDRDAIDELLSRKYKFDNPNDTSINIINSDLNISYKKNLELIHEDFSEFNKVDNIYCFFALHYLTTTSANIKNIVCLISNLLNKNGEFLYTAFDEKKIIELLKKHKGDWNVKESGIKKYSIIQKYKDADIFKKINLILPFNTSDHYYDETLINEKYLDKEFQKYKIKVKSEGSFLEFLDNFKEKKNHFYNKLTEEDKIFIDLYKYKIYKKS